MITVRSSWASRLPSPPGEESSILCRAGLATRLPEPEPGGSETDNLFRRPLPTSRSVCTPGSVPNPEVSLSGSHVGRTLLEPYGQPRYDLDQTVEYVGERDLFEQGVHGAVRVAGCP
jgi:hypothetical protein